MPQLTISQHPLIKHKLTRLRDTSTDSVAFRTLVHDLSLLMLYEATQDLPTTPTDVTTPMGTAQGVALAERIALVPIMRAGIGMVNGILDVLPEAQVWHIGLYRDEETLKPVQYYNKMPNPLLVDVAFVLDPMLATGGSAEAAVRLLKQHQVPRIAFIGLLAAPEGISVLHEAHPDVPIYVAERDERLNDIGFIVPGLGDAGDRIFGT